MAEEDLGKQGDPQDPAGGGPQGASGEGDAGPEAGATDPQGDGGPDGGVVDKHGQPGINKERHDKEVAELKAEIAKLKEEAADAADAKAKREEFEKKAAALEAKMADTEMAHKLEMAGCVDLKAAKSRLDDFDGDVAKLKESCPYLFGEEKRQSGTTGKPPAGASKAMDEKLDKIFGV
ncbi:MAG: hypothetical protein HFJ69_00440 [Enterorhabdus sp.]|jgi:membrane protein involved in colicin uptake|nr:hypothetical protein [Enterorhabdus sp.]